MGLAGLEGEFGDDDPFHGRRAEPVFRRAESWSGPQLATTWCSTSRGVPMRPAICWFPFRSVATAASLKQGNGIMTLSGANNYTGATTINAGTLQIGDAGTSGTLGSGNVIIASGAILEINRSNAYNTGSPARASAAAEPSPRIGLATCFSTAVWTTRMSSGISNIVVNNGTDPHRQLGPVEHQSQPDRQRLRRLRNVEYLRLSRQPERQRHRAKHQILGPQPDTFAIAAGSFSGTITDSGIDIGEGYGYRRYPHPSLQIQFRHAHPIRKQPLHRRHHGFRRHARARHHRQPEIHHHAGRPQPRHRRRHRAIPGSFAIDTSALTSPTTGTSWQLVDMANRTFGPTFHVVGFSPLGDGIHWLKPADGLNQWVFSETTGTLALEIADYPAWSDNAGLPAVRMTTMTPTGYPTKRNTPSASIQNPEHRPSQSR